jgi:hypothetical protein
VRTAGAAWVRAPGAALLAVAIAGQTADLDGQRSAWRYRRSAVIPAQEGFASIALPPEVAAHSQGDLRDLRLVGPEGAEIPYVVDRVVDREATRRWAGRLVDTRREPIGPAEEGGGRSVWVVDLGEERTFDTVTLEIGASDFAKRMRLEASTDGATWRTLREDAGVFDAAWAPRVHHTVLPVPETGRGRYLRLTTSDHRRSPPVSVAGVTVSATRRAEGEEWRRPLALSRIEGKAGSRYRLDLPPTFPLEFLTLEADDAAFARGVRLLEVREVSGQKAERVLAEGLLYRVKLADAALSGECLSLPVASAGQGGELVLEVADGDSPPLKRPRVTVSAPTVRLLFAAGPGPLTLYYGNEVTRAPLYDLGPVRERLALSAPAAATLGPEVENARYQRAAPLPFAAPRGAAVEVHRWKALRKLALGGSEDLHALTLAPEDLAVLRPDLGDIRLVDEEGRQVPYILEAGAALATVPLTVERVSDPMRADRRTESRYRLRPREGTSGRPLILPLAALELEVLERFFDRPARLLTEAPGGRGERALFVGRLARNVEPRAQGAPPPLVISLDGSRHSELTLQVDEGDNAPLTLTAARAVVRVPRITFKSGSGGYQLLLGNRDATVPRYDLASLRQEVLAYSALAASASSAEANPAFRRFVGDYWSDAPPTLLLWGTLLLAVVALLLLTARVIRRAP